MEPSPTQPPPPGSKRLQRDRVSAACSLCQQRKVKCDGHQPCAYCASRQRADTCVFTRTAVAPSQHATPRRRAPSTPAERPAAGDDESVHEQAPSLSSSARQQPRRESQAEDATDVPLEARLLRDAQGKMIFVGDCAPLSFLQTVRQLVASEIDAHAFPAHVTRDSVIEVAPTAAAATAELAGWVAPARREIAALVEEYYVVSSGLVDLFGHIDVGTSILARWSDRMLEDGSVVSASLLLVLAVGAQSTDDKKAASWFAHAREVLLSKLCSDMTISTVQGFVLLTLYMLRACQPNGAYLYFSMAARVGYAIGLHRTEVNASFGPVEGLQRDNMWKSLRVLDMLLSILLGRPPATSDVDCTVKYISSDGQANVDSQLLDASVQIFMILERIVIEVYSRRRISLRVAEFVSRQLKTWATQWLRTLRQLAIPTDPSRRAEARRQTVGACQTICSYHYSIMLLTRPFLIYDIYDYLGALVRPPRTQAENQEKRKFADAAVDAAIALVEHLQAAIATGQMPMRLPLVISWLFATSLVLAVGVLGKSGLSLEPHCRRSILCLDHFAKVDPHARQYAITAQTLLDITFKHAQGTEQRLRLKRKQASSELFGLLDLEGNEDVADVSVRRNDHFRAQSINTESVRSGQPVELDWNIYDADFFALPWLDENDPGLQEFLQPGKQTLDGSSTDVPLFPLNDPTPALL